MEAAPAVAVSCLAVLGATPVAQTPTAETQDPEFARLVREWTTAPEFLSPLVDHLPLQPGIPTPKDVLGYHVGAPQQLTRTADLYRYYRALAAASPRVKVTTIGQTDQGREILMVYGGSEESLRDLATHRGYLARLADPRTLSDADARAIIAMAKPIYFFSGGLHSAETGPPEMLMELAYRLAVGDSPLLRQIREQLIVTILPAAEPRIERRSIRARETRESVGRWLDVASVCIEEPQPQRDEQTRAAVVGAAAAEPDHEAAHAEVEQRPQLPAEARRRA